MRINCYDGKHGRETLKTWADKGILLCPACGNPYEYCHGMIVSPYFRHRDKAECLDKYSEPETEEHAKGKQILFDWIKKQSGVADAVLEGWLPETKQRPDIMFKLGGRQWVIEFQCSPIATEYIERHNLYQAAGINDIWILGTKNYNIYENEDGKVFHEGDLGSHKKYKVIERYNNFYLNTLTSDIYLPDRVLRNQLNLKFVRTPIKFYRLKMDSVEASNKLNMFILTSNTLSDFSDLKEKDKQLTLRHKGDQSMKLSAGAALRESIDMLEQENSNMNKSISGEIKFNQYYFYYIRVGEFTFFIKENTVDCCVLQEKSVVTGRGKRGGPRWGKKFVYEAIDTLSCSYTDTSRIVGFINKCIRSES